MRAWSWNTSCGLNSDEWSVPLAAGPCARTLCSTLPCCCGVNQTVSFVQYHPASCLVYDFGFRNRVEFCPIWVILFPQIRHNVMLVCGLRGGDVVRNLQEHLYPATFCAQRSRSANQRWVPCDIQRAHGHHLVWGLKLHPKLLILVFCFKQTPAICFFFKGNSSLFYCFFFFFTYLFYLCFQFTLL